MSEDKIINPVDVHVGMRVKEWRSARGISLQDLGAQIGVSWQQCSKYESGDNRISASRLWRISEALDVPIDDFFRGLRRKPPIKKAA